MSDTQRLDDRVSFLRGNALAPSTRRTYSTYLQTYFNFCITHGCKPFPVTNQDLGRYIAHLSSYLCCSSIKNYLSAVRHLHLEAGYGNPMSNNYYIDVLLKGMRRTLGDGSNPKLPITPNILLKILSRIDLNSPRDICFWTLCLVAFFSFFRKSNLLPPSLSEFDPSKHISRGNISFNTKGALIRVNWSKTIQYHERSLQVPLPLIQSSALCPSQALMLLFKLSPSHDSDIPAFMFSTPTGLKLLNYEGFLSRLHECLREIGIDPKKYSGHSFRRGGASFALECGLPPDLIQTQGDWRSDAYKSYIDPSLEYRQQVCQSLGKAIKLKYTAC